MTAALQVQSCYSGLAERLNSKHREEVVKWEEMRKAKGCTKLEEMEEIRRKLGIK